MKILSTSLIEYPPLLTLLGKKNNNNFCGWLYAFSKSLLEIDSTLELGILSIAPELKKWEKYQSDRFTFYRIPSKGLHKVTSKEVQMAKEILNDFQPDIIQLNGTEYSLGLEIIEANINKIPIIATIQGLSYVYERYNQGNIPLWQFYKNISFRDIIKMDGQLHKNKIMRKRGIIEQETIRRINYITGRTTWDKDHVKTINPQIQYFTCNENLRTNFYTSQKWEYKNCTPYSIFCSNGSAPLKGAHYLIQAMQIVVKVFPKAILKIIGPNVMKNDIKSKIRMTSYHKYLKKLIIDLHLENNIQFLGFLSEEKMIVEYLSANVYVLPSCIENSPNSLCEAQLLGVPCISSICGGTTDFIENNIDGFLYRCEEYEQLAQRIIKVFNLKENISNISSKAINKATNRHDRDKNAKELLNIFSHIISNKNTTPHEKNLCL